MLRVVSSMMNPLFTPGSRRPEMPGIEKTMSEFKAGTLRSSSGKKVTSREQAIAIGLSEQRRGKKYRGSKALKAMRRS